MKNLKKTNAMRILDEKKIDYKHISYEYTDGMIDGNSVAKKIKKNEDQVFKTLVLKSNTNEYFVLLIAVSAKLDMKKAAKECQVKKIEMIPVADINKVTGYIRGGCSPIGMKKSYCTIIDISAKNYEKIVVSAGSIGNQIELSVDELQKVTNAKIGDISFKE